MASGSYQDLRLPGASPREDGSTAAPALRLTLLERDTSDVRRRRGPVGTVASVLAHLGLVTLVIVVPLLMDAPLPDANHEGVHAFFASPMELAPPPPPPPPPPAGAHAAPKAKGPETVRTGEFVAPIETPEPIVADAGIDLGIEGGVAGGVEGGVPGGVVGGVIGGLPDVPPPSMPPVRVGGRVKEPTRIKDVAPVYPDPAIDAGIQGVVILECLISPQGRVTEVKVLRGVPLLEQAAVYAVRQWVYTPTLMDGVPIPVLMTVTVRFDLKRR